MKQVLGIRDEKTRINVTPPLAVAPIKLTAYSLIKITVHSDTTAVYAYEIRIRIL